MGSTELAVRRSLGGDDDHGDALVALPHGRSMFHNLSLEAEVG